MNSQSEHRCRGFTLVELVVVVMILGILAAIAAPRLLRVSDSAVDNTVRHTLSVVRDAVDSYAAQNNGAFPGADGDQTTFKADVATYLRGASFPACSVGPALNDQIRMLSGSGSFTAGIAATEASHSWVYQYEIGEFFINSTELSCDKVTTYDKF